MTQLRHSRSGRLAVTPLPKNDRENSRLFLEHVGDKVTGGEETLMFQRAVKCNYPSCGLCIADNTSRNGDRCVVPNNAWEVLSRASFENHCTNRFRRLHSQLAQAPGHFAHHKRIGDDRIEVFGRQDLVVFGCAGIECH